MYALPHRHVCPRASCGHTRNKTRNKLNSQHLSLILGTQHCSEPLCYHIFMTYAQYRYYRRGGGTLLSCQRVSHCRSPPHPNPLVPPLLLFGFASRPIKCDACLPPSCYHPLLHCLRPAYVQPAAARDPATRAPRHGVPPWSANVSSQPFSLLFAPAPPSPCCSRYILSFISQVSKRQQAVHVSTAMRYAPRLRRGTLRCDARAADGCRAFGMLLREVPPPLTLTHCCCARREHSAVFIAVTRR